MKIAVASGKGGTGKTTVAVLMASSIENSFYVDADVEEPNGHIFLKPHIEEVEEYAEPVPKIIEDKCTFCGLCAEKCPYKALAIIKPVKKALFFPELCHSCGVCSYVCPVEGALVEVPKKKGVIRKGRAGEVLFMDGVLDVGEPSATPLIRALKKRLDGVDRNIVLDAPPGTSCSMVETVEGADFVVMVAEPTPFGAHDLSLALEVVGELGLPYGIVINKDIPESDLIDRIAAERKVPILLRIPFDQGIAEMYSKGQLPVERFRDEFRQLFEKIKEMTG